MRGGLAWLDLECQRRFDKRSWPAATTSARACSTTSRIRRRSTPTPTRRPRRPSHGRAFFASFRDLTATGFWTSRMGMADLQFMGNRVVADWTGCPPEALAKLGVRYPDA